MFCSFYGLSEQPFGVTPDTRFLYLTPTHKEALATLLYAIENNRGFMSLVAAPGMGKTTLLMQLQQHFRREASIAFICQTKVSSRDLLRQVVRDFRIHSVSDDMWTLYEELNVHLVEQAKCRRKVLLIIDEAQDLEPEVLESIRLLSNFETQSYKLLQIVLVGQPLLFHKLSTPGLIQLRQRIGTVAQLRALNEVECLKYIEYRLKCAGRTEALFSVEAARTIASHCGGVPRNINHLCFNALSIAFAKRLAIVQESCVREAIQDLDKIPDVLPPAGAAKVFTDGHDSKINVYTSHPRQVRVACAGVAGITAAVLLVTLLVHHVSFSRALLVSNATSASDSSVSGVAGAPSKTVYRPYPAATTVRTISRLTPMHYTVKDGDTVAQISQKFLGRYDISTLRLITHLNPQLSDPDIVLTGQVLELPGKMSDHNGEPELLTGDR